MLSVGYNSFFPCSEWGQSTAKGTGPCRLTGPVSLDQRRQSPGVRHTPPHTHTHPCTPRIHLSPQDGGMWGKQLLSAWPCWPPTQTWPPSGGLQGRGPAGLVPLGASGSRAWTSSNWAPWGRGEGRAPHSLLCCGPCWLPEVAICAACAQCGMVF
jgi:hypothetical protein